MGDPPTQLGILQEYKEEGRIRYTGITTTSEGQYAELAQVMRDYPIDFIGIDSAIDNRVAEETILPLAQDRGIGVMVTSVPHYQQYNGQPAWPLWSRRPHDMVAGVARDAGVREELEGPLVGVGELQVDIGFENRLGKELCQLSEPGFALFQGFAGQGPSPDLLLKHPL